jgi:hypothetical protein
MPIVITPTGEYIDSVTGNPVNLPPQRPDIPRGMGVAGNGMGMARENIPANMDMGMNSMMPEEGGMMTYNVDGREVPMTRMEYEQAVASGQITPNNMGQGAISDGEMDDVVNVQRLVDMGLSPADAMEAVAREKMSNPPKVNPLAFGGNAESPNPGMGALPTPRGGTNMGMPENGMVADLMRRGYSPDMISAMTSGNMPPREDDAMNLERTGPPTITPTR